MTVPTGISRTGLWLITALLARSTVLFVVGVAAARLATAIVTLMALRKGWTAAGVTALKVE